MSYYTTFKYGSGVKYGTSTRDTLRWAIQIDWFGDDYARGYNEDDRCVALEWERGRASFLETNESGIRFPSVGRASLTLDNHDQLYNPRNTSGPYYGYIAPGKKIRIGVLTPDGASITWRFTGRVADIRFSGPRNIWAEITAEDTLQWLYDQQVDISVTAGLRIDEAISQILTAAAWPWSSSLAISSDALTYWWAKGSAASQIADLTNSGVGYFSVLGDGSARFINRSTVSSTVADFSDDNTLNNPDIALPWENYKNIIKISWLPRQLQGVGVLWSDITVASVAASSTYETFGEYAFNNENVPALYAAISASDFSANSKADGTGTNLTANFSVTLYDFGTNGKIVVRNNGATLGYLITLQISGQAVSVPYKGFYKEARTDYATNPRSWSLDLPWQQSSARAESIAVSMANLLSEQRSWPTIEVENRFDVQFLPDIFDTVRYASAFLGIDDSFRVGQIKERWLSQNGQSVRTTLKLEPYITGTTAWTWPIADFGTDTIFG